MVNHKTTFVFLALFFSWTGQAFANNDILTRQADPQQWAVANGNYNTERFSNLNQINAANANNLKLAWSFDTTVPRGHEGAPLVIKGVPTPQGPKNLMFFVTPHPNKVFAIDLDAIKSNGKQPGKFWETRLNSAGGKLGLDPVPLGGPFAGENGLLSNPKPPEGYGKVISGLHSIVCCDVVNRGPTYANGSLFITQLDGRLTKINAGTGEIVKSINILVSDEDGQPEPVGEVTTQSPLVVNDKVLVGMSGGEYGVRGWLEAWDLDLNHRQWRAYTSGPDVDMRVNTVEFPLDNSGPTMILGQPIKPGTGVTYDPDATPTGSDDERSPNGSWIPVTVNNPHLLPPAVLLPDPSTPDTFDYVDQWKQSGGATWGFISYDPALNLIYYGTGNPSTWNPANRPGDNLWSTSIIARDADTGVARWIFQMTPHDEWDYDGNMENVLADIDNVPVLIHSGRNGFNYVLNRETGMLLSANRFSVSNWTDHIDVNPTINGNPNPTYGKPIKSPNGDGDLNEVGPIVSDDPNINKSTEKVFGGSLSAKRICPTAKGPRDVLPGAYSPVTGLQYFIKGNICMDYLPRFVIYHEGAPYVGADVDMYAYDGDKFGNGDFASPKDPRLAVFDKDGKPLADPHRIDKGEFIAFDPITGDRKITIPEPQQGWAGTLVTAGNVAFYGTLDGHFKAVSAMNGTVLKDFGPVNNPDGAKNSSGIIPSGIIGNPMTYEVNGKQYVAILVGIGGWSGLPVVDPWLDQSNPQTALGVTGMNADLKTQWGGPPQLLGRDRLDSQKDNRTGTLMVFSL
jgi:lanthanide-dependent methanol dehydrogenase